MVDLAVSGLQLDLMILSDFFNLNDSVIPLSCSKLPSYGHFTLPLTRQSHLSPFLDNPLQRRILRRSLATTLSIALPGCSKRNLSVLRRCWKVSRRYCKHKTKKVAFCLTQVLVKNNSEPYKALENVPRLTARSVINYNHRKGQLGAQTLFYIE